MVEKEERGCLVIHPDPNRKGGGPRAWQPRPVPTTGFLLLPPPVDPARPPLSPLPLPAPFVPSLPLPLSPAPSRKLRRSNLSSWSSAVSTLLRPEPGFQRPFKTIPKLCSPLPVSEEPLEACWDRARCRPDLASLGRGSAEAWARRFGGASKHHLTRKETPSELVTAPAYPPSRS